MNWNKSINAYWSKAWALNIKQIKCIIVFEGKIYIFLQKINYPNPTKMSTEIFVENSLGNYHVEHRVDKLLIVFDILYFTSECPNFKPYLTESYPFVLGVLLSFRVFCDVPKFFFALNVENDEWKRLQRKLILVVI